MEPSPPPDPWLRGETAHANGTPKSKTFKAWGRAVATVPRQWLGDVFRNGPDGLPCGLHGVKGTKAEAAAGNREAQAWLKAAHSLQLAIIRGVVAASKPGSPLKEVRYAVRWLHTAPPGG